MRPLRYARPRPWARMTDAEWTVLATLLPPAEDRPGRPLAEPRRRWDAFFWIARTGQPWRALPAELGRRDAAERHFRRLARQGVFTRLLRAAADTTSFPDLASLEHRICRLFRRATRLIGAMTAIRIARYHGMASALRTWHPLAPDPDLSDLVARIANTFLDRYADDLTQIPRGLLTTIGRLHQAAGGRRRYHSSMAPP